MLPSNQKTQLHASLPLAIMDALPVLCFSAAMLLLCQVYESVLFFVGAILCTMAGAGKVLWKFLLAVTKKNVSLLSRQFRVLMPLGVAFMLLSLAADRPSPTIILKNALGFPCRIFFAIAIVCMVLMGIFARKLNQSSAKANWLEQSVNLIAQLCVLLAIGIIWYGADYYHADVSVTEAAEAYPSVSVIELDNGLLLDGSGENTALIFYPGAKVEYTAYLPIMLRLAESGIDCFLIEMPYHLAIFDLNAADDLLSAYDYDTWYLGGHSLGGAMAAFYAAKHTDSLSGLILFAAYATKDLGNFPVLSIYGTLDEVVNAEKLQAGTQYSTAITTVEITGGNHAWFGSYGTQSGDGTATITHEDQWEQTVAAILEFISQ